MQKSMIRRNEFIKPPSNNHFNTNEYHIYTIDYIFNSPL